MYERDIPYSLANDCINTNSQQNKCSTFEITNSNVSQNNIIYTIKLLHALPRQF